MFDSDSDILELVCDEPAPKLPREIAESGLRVRYRRARHSHRREFQRDEASNRFIRVRNGKVMNRQGRPVCRIMSAGGWEKDSVFVQHLCHHCRARDGQ
ncbi:unnamed protein product [Mycena citricolor]|uniref:Uncharacterized protein n=1 Tax=Mycena citricolor TaxID=2018698 RepID=A0AAD2H4H5_9AGAR|nr:unnamed protein product [Mycena citricolor]